MKSEVSGDVFRFNSCYRNETDSSFITFPVDDFYFGYAFLGWECCRMADLFFQDGRKSAALHEAC